MSFSLAARFAPAPLPPELVRSPLLRATRLWVRRAKAQRNPRLPLNKLLGPGAAASFGVFMDMMTSAWTDEFVAFRPRHKELSIDESTLLTLLSSAESGDVETAHGLLAEMLPHAERARLFGAATRVMAELKASRLN